MELARAENTTVGSSRKKCVSIIAICSLVILVIVVSVLTYIYTADSSASTGDGWRHCPAMCHLQTSADAKEASVLHYGQSIWETTVKQFKDDQYQRQEICCHDIGCFDNGHPFAEFPLPVCVNVSKITYTLFTPRNTEGVTLELRGPIPEDYSPSHRTVVITHGYQSSGNSTWIRQLRETILTNHGHLINIIVLDWSNYATHFFYSQSAANGRALGAYTALMLQQFAEEAGADYADTWCIGHSLGAHICGYTGLRTAQKIGRITGLDPAGPCFECHPNVTIGLNAACARLVEVIHTDAVGTLVGEFGTKRALGHVDFYPNGLGNQPGCVTKRRRRRRRKRQLLHASCSHARAYHLFTEALERKDACVSQQKCTDVDNIPASCNSCSEGECPVMGFNSSAYSEGIFYFRTQNTPPYCTG